MPLLNIEYGIFQRSVVRPRYCKRDLRTRVTRHRTSGHSFLPQCKHTSQPRLAPIFIFRSASVSRGDSRIVASNRSTRILTTAIALCGKTRRKRKKKKEKERKTKRNQQTVIMSVDFIARNERSRFHPASLSGGTSRAVRSRAKRFLLRSTWLIVSDRDSRLRRSSSSIRLFPPDSDI